MFSPRQEKASFAEIARAWALESGCPVPEVFQTLLAGYCRGEFESPGMDKPEVRMLAIERVVREGHRPRRPPRTGRKRLRQMRLRVPGLRTRNEKGTRTTGGTIDTR